MEQRHFARLRVTALLFVLCFSQPVIGTSAPNVVSWGDNTYGQTNVPTDLTNAVAIAAGVSHSLILRVDGTVAAWGDNTYGQTNVPAGLSNVVVIAAGGAHNVALRSDGTLVAWGNFTNVARGLTNIVAVAAGTSHNLALRADGTVIAWGTNQPMVGAARGTLDFGQTDVPSDLENLTAIAAGGDYSMAVRADGTVFAWGMYLGFEYWYPMEVPSELSNIVAVAAGGQHALALAEDGSLWQWGDSHLGQAVGANGLTNAIAVVGGGAHSLAVRPDGTVYAWGFNNDGQTTVPPGLSNVVAVAGGGYHSLALLGPAAPGQPRPLFNRTIAQQAGTAIFYAPAAAGWALSYQWQCNGTNISGATNAWLLVTHPTLDQTGLYSVVARNVWGVANTPIGQLTVLPAAFSRPPEDVVTNLWGTATFQAIVQGVGPFSYQWRFNGQDLVGETGSALRIEHLNWDQQGSYSVSVSNRFGSILSRNARLDLVNVAGWGLNDDWPFYVFHGQATPPAGLTNAIAVAAGFRHSLVLRADRSIVAWGANESGELNLPADLTNTVAIAAGGAHDLALRTDGTVAAWGSDSSSESDVPPGLSNVVAVAAGGSHSLALRSDGTVVAWGSNGAGQTNVPAGLSNVVAIAAGQAHNLVLLSDGTMAVWGYYSRWNPSPPPGVYAWEPMYIPSYMTNWAPWMTNWPIGYLGVACGESSCLAVAEDRRGIGWGNDRSGESDVPRLENLLALAGGQFHSVALRTDGSVVAWGDNSVGQTNVPAGLRNVIAIAAGDEHNLALLGTGPVPKQVPLSNATFSNNVFTVSLPTQSGRVYRLEYKNSPINSTWTPLPLVAGIGGTQILTDPIATTSTRFYRVRQW